MLSVVLFLCCVTSAIGQRSGGYNYPVPGHRSGGYNYPVPRQRSGGYHYPVPGLRLDTPLQAPSPGLRADSPSQSCRLGYSGQNGVCQRFSNCPSAQNAYYRNRITPTFCQSNRAVPIVCCPVAASNVPIVQSTPPRSAALRQGGGSIRLCNETHINKPLVQAIVVGEVTAPLEFPYMTAIGWPKGAGSGYEYLCGGSLIAPKFVLSAAHCTSVSGVAPVVTRTGGVNLGDANGSDIPITRIHVHPGYRRREVYNDIALFEIQSTTGYDPACLWQSPNINTPQATAIGYGHTQFAGRGSKQLLKVVLSVFSNQECSRYYSPAFRLSRGIIDSQLCVGDPNKIRDTCQGDSGGPVVFKTIINRNDIPYIIGVTSFGQGCAGGPPSIYTRVSSYIDWIESIVWPSG